MIDALDLKAMQDHHDREMRANLPIVFAATSQDKRVIDLVAQFNAADERGRVTLLRMAQVMPKNDSTKEICR